MYSTYAAPQKLTTNFHSSVCYSAVMHTTRMFFTNIRRLEMETDVYLRFCFNLVGYWILPERIDFVMSSASVVALHVPAVDI